MQARKKTFAENKDSDPGRSARSVSLAVNLKFPIQEFWNHD